MLKVAENALNEPFAIFAPAEDENQIYTANLAAARTLGDLGYRYRMWTFLTEEHESPGVFDEWSEAARYLFGFKLDRSPAEVRFARDMPLEHEVERGTGKVANPAVHLSFPSAYWVRDLEPADAKEGHATIDARTLAVPHPPHQARPEEGTPAAPSQTAPHLTIGQAWTQSDPAPPTSNGFTAKLTGASAVTLDTATMRISTSRPISGDLSSDHALTLSLLGRFDPRTRVTVDGVRVAATVSGSALTISLPPGRHRIVIKRT